MNYKWPKTLLRSLAYNNLTIFFGAGVPYELGFPLWGELLTNLQKELEHNLSDNISSELQRYIQSNDYLNAVDLLMYHEQEKVIDIIESTFKLDDFELNKLEDSNENLLFSLNANTYLTTNIDNSLDEVKGLSGKKAANIYSYKNETDIRDKLIFHDSEKDPLIIRLHGELKDLSSLIFSQRQYTALNQNSTFVFNQLLPALFLTSTVLIIGYSVNDPDIQLVLENISKTRGVRDNLFLLNSDKNLSEHQKLLFNERFGIKVFDIHLEKDCQTNILKAALKELVNIKEKINSIPMNEKRTLFKCGDSTMYEKIGIYLSV